MCRLSFTQLYKVTDNPIIKAYNSRGVVSNPFTTIFGARRRGFQYILERKDVRESKNHKTPKENAKSDGDASSGDRHDAC